MEMSLRRFLGLYFVVTSLQYLPAAVFMLGAINSTGPNWILPAISLTQGAITAVAGFVLYRSAASADESSGTLATPGVPVLVQLVGVYFVVAGLVGGIRPV